LRPVPPRARPGVEELEGRLNPGSLQLSLSPHSIVEIPGPAGTTVGTVTRLNTGNTQSLTVSLSSSNSAELTFPSSVVIPANQASTTFNVSAVPDTTGDGVQNVTVTGTALLPAATAIDPTFGGGSVSQPYLPSAVAIQPDGKVVTAGQRYNGGTDPWSYAVSRYNTDGSLDTTFGGNGTVYTNVSGQADEPHAVVIQPDGKIVVGGTGGNGPNFYWDLARYNTDGSLDTTFGTGGKVVTLPSGSTSSDMWDLTLQPDGKIVVAGDATVGSNGDMIVARYNTNGTLDTNFGSGGIALSNPAPTYGNAAFSVLVQPDGKIVLAGESKGGNYNSEFVVSRFTSGGVPDTTFGGTGTVQTDLPGSYEQGQDAVLQPDGKIVVVGYVSPVGLFPPVDNFALVRYNTDGSLDPSFGSGGITISDFGGSDAAQRVALQPDGRIEVVGYGTGTPWSTERTIVAWYTPNGTLGSYTTSSNVGVLGKALALQSNGAIVAVSQSGTQVALGYVERYVDSTAITGSDTVAVQDPAGPAAYNDAYTASENTPLTVSTAAGVLANDTDSSGTLTAVQLSNPANGTVTLNADGSFTYTPNSGFIGTDTFTYKATDGTSDSNVATVTVTVTAPAPTANNDSYSTNENTPLSVTAPGVLGNDTDPNNNPLSAVRVTSPVHGTLQLAANGSFTYTPSTYFYGTDSFTYEAFNGSTYSSPATVTITVNHVNQPPTAANQGYALNENGSLTVQAPGVLANSSDPDGDPRTAVLFGYQGAPGPSHGTLTLNPDGSFTYTPNHNFYGTDGFTFRAFDGSLYSTPASVTLTVRAIAPTANNDSYSVNENSAISVGTPGVLGNDTATTVDALSSSVVAGPAHGTVTLNVNGSFIYTPTANFYGTDSFTYHDTESGLISNTATVTITVNFVDRPPVAVNDAYTVNEDSTLNVTQTTGGTTSLTMNSQPGDYIGAGHTYAYTPATGTFSVSHSSNDNYVGFSYSEAANSGVWWYVDLEAPNGAPLTPGYYAGAVRYPFQASNQPGLDISGEGRGSNTLTGNFTVVQAVYGANGQVISFDATFEQHSEGAAPALFGEIKYNYSPTPAGVLGNDTDPDGQTITAAVVTGPSNGSLTLNPDGTFTYAPNADYVGADSFTYQASDGTLNSNTATVNITVNPVNEAPSFVAGANQTLVEGAGAQTVPGWATASSAGPPNEASQALNFLVSTNNNSLFAVAPTIDPATGTLTYTPAPGALGSATVTVQLHDNGGTANGGVDTSAPQTFVVTVNDATPTFTLGGPASVDEGSAYTLSLAAVDPDTVTDWTITWGDGIVQTVTGNPSSVAHLFPYGANSYTISATADDEDGTHAAANTVAVSVVPVQLAIVGPSTATAGSPFSLTVTALDSSGNLDTTYSGTVHFTTSGAASLPLDYTFGPGDAGSHLFSGVILDTAGNQSITATDTNSATITGSQTTAVSAAPATQFVVTGPQSATAGIAFTEFVTAEDSYGNVSTGYTGTVHISSSDGLAILPQDAPLNNGTGSFTVTLVTAGSQSITATDLNNSTITGSQTTAVGAAPATQFAVVGPQSATAGVAFTEFVTAQDSYGNLATGYTGTVHLTSSDGHAILPQDAPLNNGTGSFTVTLDTAGNQSITATDLNNATITGAQTTAVSAAGAARFAVTGPSSATAGVAFTEYVTAQDAFGNVATGYTGTVHLSSSDGHAVVSHDSTLNNGTGSFTVTFQTAGSQSITATDTNSATITGTQTTAVGAAAATRFVVTGPSSATAGVAFTESVTAQDAFGNVATGYTGTVHITSLDGHAMLPQDATLNNGTGSFTVTLKTAGNQSLTATDTNNATITGTQSGIAVGAATAATFTVSGYPAATAGTAHTFTVTARDAFGNVATGYTGTVHITSSDGQAGFPVNYQFTGTDAGVHTFSATLKTAGAQSITATDTVTAGITGTQSGIVISAAAATHFQITAPASARVGAAFTVTVTALDAYGNVATGYRGTVHFTSSDHHAVLPSNYTFVSGDNGVHSFTVSLHSSGTRSITATDTATGSITGSANVNAI
jgi:uncharacterized delta-60 repeat protein